MDDADLPVQELGLVMAGAVSAGAYTAGVADFLIQAMDAWDTARTAGDAAAPAHRVRLKAIAGASAGAMTAAIAAGILGGRPHRPLGCVDPGPVVDDNALFDSWVNRIDAEQLLDTGDLTGGHGRIVSLLNGDTLEAIAAAALPALSVSRRRAWVADDLRLAFSVTNLRGVPYNLGFGDSSHAPQPRPGHSMRRHADLMRFRLARPGAPPAGGDQDVIDLDCTLTGEGWTRLRAAALASGAFPLMLPAKALSRPASDYDARLWPMPGIPGAEGDGVRYQRLPPHWGDGPPPSPFDFMAVDGGVLDNQPFAAGRDLLVGTPPRAPDPPVSGRSLITISPFPDLVGFRPNEEPPSGLLDVALRLLAAMRNQTRFQPDELMTAADDPYATRLLIAPSRRVDGVRVDHPVAGGAVDGFAGFLDRAFRLHDFQLGRLNCQRFLLHHYRLPDTHPLFARWHREQRQRHGNGTGRLPVVPLLGDAALPVPSPGWPCLPPERLARLRVLLRHRVRALLPHAIDHLLARSHAPMRWATRLLARYQSGGWARAMTEHIARELRARGQL